MKTLTWLHMSGCPYCRMADEVFEELKSESPEFAAVEVEAINETFHPKKAAEYDYYYNPCFFVDGEKVFETSPGDDRETIKAGLRKALELCV